ncbi:DUF7342 family protein [Halospeciosus flavus]|uniref:Uncharacterized protein n=1 Tax=Halospeciosus flavus TaxID=3032283 RepID=A0ABD5Z381_9EURY|nr:hypothetical protein [Halospeciosus flavus]
MGEENTDWPADMDAGERLKHVAETRTTPRNAGWIADEAAVSRDTAAKYLSQLVDQGLLTTVETDRGTCYKPDTVTQFLNEVRDLAEAHTLNELTAELNAIVDEIDAWKDEYDVDSLTALRQSIGREDFDHDERQKRLEAISEWEYNIEIREAIQVANALRSSLTTLEADTLTSTSSGNYELGIGQHSSST